MSEILQEPQSQSPSEILSIGALPYGPEGPPRVLGRLGPESGPTLICVAGLHGNEPMGVVGLERALSRIESSGIELRGQLVGLVGNRKALSLGKRYLDHDLNRAWFADRIEALRGASVPLTDEDDELAELDRELEPILRRRSGSIFLLDLHTTSGPGPAFSVLEDTLTNRAFALNFPVPMVLGFEEEIGGTLANYLCERGVIGIGLEAGQHSEPLAAERAEAAVWIAIGATGLIANGEPELADARRRLAGGASTLPTSVEVRHRHAITQADGFQMNSGRRSFQPVETGEQLARDRSGEIVSPARGLLLMPLYQEQGDDGFFVVRRVRPIWLQVSALVRRYRFERFLHRLPGVRRHAERPGAFIVNRRIARFLTLDLFHLLGFKRVGPAGRFVVMTRRRYDEPSPSS